MMSLCVLSHTGICIDSPTIDCMVELHLKVMQHQLEHVSISCPV
jgi:hypothetical protein